jgi:hypothetical protein
MLATQALPGKTGGEKAWRATLPPASSTDTPSAKAFQSALEPALSRRGVNPGARMHTSKFCSVTQERYPGLKRRAEA